MVLLDVCTINVDKSHVGIQQYAELSKHYGHLTPHPSLNSIHNRITEQRERWLLT